jgi:NADPH2:quinone reductase
LANNRIAGLDRDAITVAASAHYALENAAQAHCDLQDRKTVGSIVLTPQAGPSWRDCSA